MAISRHSVHGLSNIFSILSYQDIQFMAWLTHSLYDHTEPLVLGHNGEWHKLCVATSITYCASGISSLIRSTLFAILSACIFWGHYSLIKPNCSNVRLIIAFFLLMSDFFSQIFTISSLFIFRPLWVYSLFIWSKVCTRTEQLSMWMPSKVLR